MQNKQVKKLLAMNIQKFADGVENTAQETVNNNPPEPTMDDLIARIAELETANAQKDAEATRWKNASDKASGEAANYKRQLTARMSAQEQADAAKQEAEEARNQQMADLQKEVAQLRRDKTITTTQAFFMGKDIAMEESLALEMATAQIDGDADKFNTCFKKFVKSVEERVRISLLGERRDIHAGNGTDDTDPAVALAKSVTANRRNTQFNQDAIKAFL